MIETKIDALIEALTANTAALNAVLAQSAVTPLPGNPMPKKGKTKIEVVEFHPDKEPTKTVMEEVDIPPAETEEDGTVTVTVSEQPEDAEQPAAEFNRDELIATITATVKENYRKAGNEIVAVKAAFEALRNEFGCQSVKELSDEKLVEFWPRLQAIS